MEQVVEVLVVGSDLAKRATAGLITNLAGGETDSAEAFRRRATGAGAVRALRALTTDPTATPEVRDVAALALQNLHESLLAGVLGNTTTALLVPVLVAGGLYWLYTALAYWMQGNEAFS